MFLSEIVIDRQSYVLDIAGVWSYKLLLSNKSAF